MAKIFEHHAYYKHYSDRTCSICDSPRAISWRLSSKFAIKKPFASIVQIYAFTYPISTPLIFRGSEREKERKNVRTTRRRNYIRRQPSYHSEEVDIILLRFLGTRYIINVIRQFHLRWARWLVLSKILTRSEKRFSHLL